MNSLAGGIAMMLGGSMLCYAAVKDTFDPKTGRNKYEINPLDPIGWTKPLYDAFNGINTSQNSNGLTVGNGPASVRT